MPAADLTQDSHIVDSLAQGVFVCDAEGVLLRVNPALERLTGCLLYTSDAADE